MTLIVIVMVLAFFVVASARWGVDSRDPRYSVGALLHKNAHTDDEGPQ